MKSKFNNGIVASAITALLILMTYSCAQQRSTISGGDKDTLAPTMRRSTPVELAGDFDGKTVKIKFDEYFTLDKIDQTFLMSPPHDSVRPKVRAKGKKITVKLKEPLKPDTTYTLQFFNSIKDLNEGNTLRNFSFAFGTGPTVDSLAISGRVMDAYTLETESEMLVSIYGETEGFSDSSFINRKPDYITRTDSAGHFVVPNVRPGKYRIFALKDINETQRFDLENEKVAFLKTAVEPKGENLVKIDSLWAGMVIHKGAKGHRYLDTLKYDTVIKQHLYYTTPNNITLFSFEEKHLVQYISERNRDIRERINIVFNKSVENDTVLITYVDDTLRSPQMIYDYNYGRDSLTVWLKDTADINNDTLQIRITFATLDSLKRPTTETDTLNMKFVKKKAVAKGKDKEKKAEKTKAGPKIDSLCFNISSNLSGDFDINKSIKITLPIVLSHTDTSMIKLYECVDSSFAEDKNQKLLKNLRLDSTQYRLIFKRPVYGNIVWYPTDSVVSPNWYRVSYSAGRDTVNLEVLDSAMAKRGKFANMLKYHNEYYMGQIQKIRDSVNTVIIDQKMVKYERPSRDSIKILFEKAPKKGISIEAINVDKIQENGMEVIQNGELVTVLLRDSAAIMKDTLALKINTFDRYVRNRNQKVVERNFKDTIFAMYTIKYQRLMETKLMGKDTIQFAFQYKLAGTPKVHLLQYPEKGTRWYSDSLSDKRDILILTSNDRDFLNLDTIKYVISYPSINRNEEPEMRIDTLMIARPEERKEQERTGRRRSNIGQESQRQQAEAQKNMAKASLRFPVEYSIAADSMDSKNLILTFDGKPGKQYMLEIDDSTFTSIYGTPNLYLSSKAKIRDLDYYGEFTLNLKNVGNIERYPDIDEDLPPFQEIDTSRTLRRKVNPLDSLEAEHPAISQGQLLVCLCNEKGEIKYQQVIKSDSTLSFQHIVPADYTVKIIHDRNLNGKWDTGKYIEQHYPERCVEYPKKQTVKSQWNTEADWRL